MGGEQLLSKLAAWSTFVVFPSAVIAYCLSVPEKPAANKEKGLTSPTSK